MNQYLTADKISETSMTFPAKTFTFIAVETRNNGLRNSPLRNLPF